MTEETKNKSKLRNWQEVVPIGYRGLENELSAQKTEAIVNYYKALDVSSLLTLVKEGRSKELATFVDSGADVNQQDEEGMTALHYAAAYGARPCIRILVNSGRCDYLLKDSQGRYASELAFEQAQDYAVGILLVKKEAKQAREQGVQNWPK